MQNVFNIACGQVGVMLTCTQNKSFDFQHNVIMLQTDVLQTKMEEEGKALLLCLFMFHQDARRQAG